MTTTAATPNEAAADTIRRHHAHMVSDLERLVGALHETTDETFPAARGELLTWLRTVLAPHAAGEETTFYRSGAELEAGRLLVAGMTAEHGVILGLVDEVERAAEPAVAAAWAGAVLRVFVSHAGKENDLLLPLLTAAPGVDLKAELENLHESH